MKKATKTNKKETKIQAPKVVKVKNAQSIVGGNPGGRRNMVYN